MFRCLTNLKGLIIDVDSFDDFDTLNWNKYLQNYKCLFLTFSSETENKIKAKSDAIVYLVDDYERFFAPNEKVHGTALNKMSLLTSEVAYISKDLDFLNNALTFFSGTIWITENVNYEQASIVPDLVCNNIDNLEYVLENNITGFYGETSIYPNDSKNGMILSVEFNVDGQVSPLYMLGRYFGYQHYMSQLHPYSSSIFLNKKERGKAYGKFDDEFADLFCNTINEIQENMHIDGICAVPTRPNSINRFNHILDVISNECHINNLSGNFICLKSYPEQKNLPGYKREANVKGNFSYNGDLSGEIVVIIDDVISTGSTIRECIRELKRKGVDQVIIVVLAVNQTKGNYWSSFEPYVKCPKCGKKMHLLVNSNNLKFFYSCYDCGETIDFKVGMESLVEQINNEGLRSLNEQINNELPDYIFNEEEN